MKLPHFHLAALLCAAQAMLFAAAQALAAERLFYPISVESYMVGDTPGIKKVYQLSLSDDPSGIPTGDFEENGYVYHLLDMTQAHDVGVDTQERTETITQDSSTGKLSEVLKQLEGQKEITTEDGYTGTLLLDHTSVQVQAKGYRTSTKNLSVSRTYPNLSDADLSLVPKTVTDGGHTLTLSNVQWSEQVQEDGSLHYTASAVYAGTATSRYATGYIVTANYVGQVAKTNCEIATYTAIYTGTKIEPEPTQTPAPPEETPEASQTPAQSEAPVLPSPEQTAPPAAPEPAKSGVDWLTLFGCAGGVAGLAVAGVFLIQKTKERKQSRV